MKKTSYRLLTILERSLLTPVKKKRRRRWLGIGVPSSSAVKTKKRAAVAHWREEEQHVGREKSSSASLCVRCFSD
ncbi:hypothetical protein DEO72_LG1g2960 [Vigna unguiculata]|uniref:Uncharacterized protein n=1 Tax=Vigna unguiculata TaxID=3917 RepID=A0A4D6KXN1_VIGUN|nr:hypothetical protein DEO72_LG1g2960 [Vigna unguiculata]